MDIQSRVVNFYKNNQFVQKYLKGIDPKTNEVVLGFNNETRRVSIDVLETLKSEDSLIGYLQGRTVTPQVNEVPNIEVPTMPDRPAVTEPQVSVPAPSVNTNLSEVSITPVAKEQTMLVDNSSITSNKETLDDIKILIELKNKEGLDNVLKEFAVNPSTGLIDINKAISMVTRNTMDEVEKSIKNNYEFSSDMTSFDPQGIFTGTPITGTSTDDEKIVSSFKNIKIFLDASKMYPEQANYNEEQISNFMKTYMQKVKDELGGATGSVPSAPASAEPVNQVPTPQMQPTQEVPVSASAGFADIFVLTVIVLVYAVIIVNLILKLN